jgi:hypothetical protein
MEVVEENKMPDLDHNFLKFYIKLEHKLALHGRVDKNNDKYYQKLLLSSENHLKFIFNTETLVRRTFFVNQLYKLIKYYEKIEDYEKCIILKYIEMRYIKNVNRLI